MNADSYFVCGDTHLVCEDYAFAGTHGHHTFAIVSDGCSSAPNTDFGSRFLVRATRQQFKNQAGNEVFELDATAILDDALDMVIACHLPSNCLLATLLIAWADPEKVNVMAWGDGVIAGRRRDGTWKYISIEYHYSAPAYLAYRATGNAEAYKDQTENGSRSVYVVEAAEGLPPKETRKDRDGMFADKFEFPAAEFDLVVLMSDGAQTFHRPLGDIVEEVMSIKTTKEKFITRRVKRLIKHHRRDGGSIDDDFAVAAIYVPEPTEEEDLQDALFGDVSPDAPFGKCEECGASLDPTGCPSCGGGA